jgi:KTSC domain
MENPEVDRLVPKPMAAGPTQRVEDNAFHLPGFRIQNLSRENPKVENLHLFSTDCCRVGKKLAAMRRIALVFCISIAFVAVALAKPSPTPSHITSRIPRQSVQSTAIAKIGYSKRRHILEIEFVNGAVYRYLDIPLSVHRDLMSAESKARFYDSNIRKHYRSVLVRPRQKQEPPAKSSASGPGYGAAPHE